MTKFMKSVKSAVPHSPPYRHPCPAWWDRIRDHGLRGLHGPYARQDTDRSLASYLLGTALQKAAA